MPRFECLDKVPVELDCLGAGFAHERSFGAPLLLSHWPPAREYEASRRSRWTKCGYHREDHIEMIQRNLIAPPDAPMAPNRDAVRRRTDCPPPSDGRITDGLFEPLGSLTADLD